MKELFALTILRIINIGFRNSANGRNPEFIALENRTGNTIYVSSMESDHVLISAYKVTKICLKESITDISQLEAVIDVLKTKVKCDDLES